MSLTQGSRPTITLHMVSSIDGVIAKRDNSVSWLEDSGDVYEKGVADDGAQEVAAIDCFVLGSRTYEHALEIGWPYGDTPTIVVTSRKLPAIRQSVAFYSGDLRKLVDEVLAPRYRNVWLVGGAMLCRGFLELGLVDEIRLAVVPVVLGDGLRLFDESCAEQRWKLGNVVAYRTGVVELSYQAARRPEAAKPETPC